MKKLNQWKIKYRREPYNWHTNVAQELETAHIRYLNEVSPGDLFYRVAIELVDLSIRKKNRKCEFM